MLQVGSTDARPDCTGGHTCMCTQMWNIIVLLHAWEQEVQVASRRRLMHSRSLTSSSWGTFLCLMRILYFSSCVEWSVHQTQNNSITMQCMVCRYPIGVLRLLKPLMHTHPSHHPLHPHPQHPHPPATTHYIPPTTHYTPTHTSTDVCNTLDHAMYGSIPLTMCACTQSASYKACKCTHS